MKEKEEGEKVEEKEEEVEEEKEEEEKVKVEEKVEEEKEEEEERQRGGKEDKEREEGGKEDKGRRQRTMRAGDDEEAEDEQSAPVTSRNSLRAFWHLPSWSRSVASDCLRPGRDPRERTRLSRTMSAMIALGGERGERRREGGGRERGGRRRERGEEESECHVHIFYL